MVLYFHPTPRGWHIAFLAPQIAVTVQLATLVKQNVACAKQGSPGWKRKGSVSNALSNARVAKSIRIKFIVFPAVQMEQIKIITVPVLRISISIKKT